MCKRIFANQTSQNESVPFYKIGTLGGIADSYISKELFKEYKSKYNFPKIGETLITCSGTVGKCIQFDGQDAYFQDSNIVWLRSENSPIINDFLFRLIDKKDWSQLNTTTISRIYTSDLLNLKFYYPSSKSEQEKIVLLLNKIDKRIETQNKIIDNLKSQIKSISSRVYKLFPKTSKLSELINFEKKTNHKSEEGLKEGRYPFYTNEENQNKFFNSYDFDGLFILSNTGGRANFKIVNGKFAVMSDTLVIKFKNPLLARTYINFLQNNTEKISHDIFAGSGLKHLDKNAFLNMNVPLVDKDLSIINKLFETLDNKLINEKKYLSLLIIQKQYLLNNLFI